MSPSRFSVLALLLLSAYCWAEESDLSVSEIIENANKNIVRREGEPMLIEGDIAIDNEAERNADPCTSRGCKWGKYTDGKVYIPYYIANHFSSREKSIITRGLESFSSFSCIRFRPSRSSDRDWLSIESRDGCWSYVGRRGGKQTVSLNRGGCLYHNTVQHELLHALGFNHEQTRSDRDNHIRVLLENVVSGMEHNFNKIATLNQGTPYDYGSVMQYFRTAFSKNGKPTMIPIPNANVNLGNAREMSSNDKKRLNSLYQCWWGPGCAIPGNITVLVFNRGRVRCELGSGRGQGPRQLSPRTQKLAVRTWNVTSLGGKEPELVREVERYRLDVVGLISTHSLGSGTQPLERGWTLHFSGVACGERRRAGVGLLIAPTGQPL
ncbi:hatching enzyme 1.2-like [Boleophthalmus pectinirostris]|uniref:hatching enzyme 1.2-like n=1 Tax=Boleophthalmus pectinirostris TaxID=150288 RepID=UPI0024314BE2|nr:hatching enzyme 1.2-like [Boleophthalmus pectinirostris]